MEHWLSLGKTISLAQDLQMTPCWGPNHFGLARLQREIQNLHLFSLPCGRKLTSPICPIIASKLTQEEKVAPSRHAKGQGLVSSSSGPLSFPKSPRNSLPSAPPSMLWLLCSLCLSPCPCSAPWDDAFNYGSTSSGPPLILL